MDDVLAYIGRELPAINDFLERSTEGLDPIVKPPVQHVLKAGGKRLRPLLTLLAARAAGLDAGVDPYPLACSLEILHSATLLHDDILDGADLRRGDASAHTVYGKSETILAGDVLLALANRMVAGYGEPRLTDVLSEAILRTVTGEVKEIAATRQVDLSEDDYLDIITGKTAYLFQGACQAGAILAGADPTLERAAHDYGLNLGIAFQLVDDALDYVNPSQVTGKPSGGDLREGKMTMPLILYLRGLEPARSDALKQAIADDALTESQVSQVVAAVQQGGYAETIRQEAQRYIREAAEALKPFAPGEETSIMGRVLEFVISRDK